MAPILTLSLPLYQQCLQFCRDYTVINPLQITLYLHQTIVNSDSYCKTQPILTEAQYQIFFAILNIKLLLLSYSFCPPFSYLLSSSFLISISLLTLSEPNIYFTSCYSSAFCPFIFGYTRTHIVY